MKTTNKAIASIYFGFGANKSFVLDIFFSLSVQCGRGSKKIMTRRGDVFFVLSIKIKLSEYFIDNNLNI